MPTSALGPLADMGARLDHVRFTPGSGHQFSDLMSFRMLLARRTDRPCLCPTQRRSCISSGRGDQMIGRPWLGARPIRMASRSAARAMLARKSHRITFLCASGEASRFRCRLAHTENPSMRESEKPVEINVARRRISISNNHLIFVWSSPIYAPQRQWGASWGNGPRFTFA
jgi:hypothetical protein